MRQIENGLSRWRHSGGRTICHASSAFYYKSFLLLLLSYRSGAMARPAQFLVEMVLRRAASLSAQTVTQERAARTLKGSELLLSFLSHSIHPPQLFPAFAPLNRPSTTTHPSHGCPHEHSRSPYSIHPSRRAVLNRLCPDRDDPSQY
jgi:hypothetical protein